MKCYLSALLFFMSFSAFSEDVPHSLNDIERLSSMGISVAKVTLAECYIQGGCTFADKKTLEKDINKGLKILEEAASLANDIDGDAAFRLGDYLLLGQNGVQQDKNKAHKYLKKSAEAGNTKAMYYLAVSYMSGEIKPEGPVPADLQAMNYSLEACTKGLQVACELNRIEEHYKQ
ncbi:MAG: sel1 repeat family protein [Cardiobacteriaceae bacterium]|nr:sel1 repeat family protein [Cardiobacteriaceae bacterium]